MIRKICYIGHPIFQKRAKKVEHFDTPELNALIDDLFENMAHYNGAGLAATQIGFDCQVFVYGVKSNPRYPQMQPIPPTVMINPEITDYSQETDFFMEGCLSVPNLRGNVERSKKITVEAYNVLGEKVKRTVEGFEARAVQHEIDHFHGKFFIQRMKDLSSLTYSEI